jgi:hypothetical protein
MNSLEALDKIVEKYDWLGKEYCRLIGKGDELHKFNQTAFVECSVTPIKQDLECLKVLKKYLIEMRVGSRLVQVLKVKDVQGIVLIKDFENEEDFNKIQEWLNNNE